MRIDSDYRESVTLSDGREMLVRIIRPEDKQLLVEALERSSLGTVYGRFLTPRSSFSEEELRYLTEFDGVNHVALGAEYGGRGVGVARLVRDPSDPATAEISFAVDEDFRQVGLASALLNLLLSAAQERGFQKLTCLAFADNEAVSRLLLKAGFTIRDAAQGTRTYERNLESG